MKSPKASAPFPYPNKLKSVNRLKGLGLEPSYFIFILSVIILGLKLRTFEGTRINVSPKRVTNAVLCFPIHPIRFCVILSYKCSCITETVSMPMADWILIASIPSRLSHLRPTSYPDPGKCNARSFVNNHPSCYTEPLGCRRPTVNCQWSMDEQNK